MFKKIGIKIDNVMNRTVSFKKVFIVLTVFNLLFFVFGYVEYDKGMLASILLVMIMWIMKPFSDALCALVFKKDKGLD